ncbi:MAG: suppressor of fused domain protein [Pirellulales bacterium]
MPSDAETFIEHLHSVFGNEDAIHKANADDGGPPVAVFAYHDIPEPGMVTGVTYGLSLCNFAAWKLSRPEMIVSVNSTSLDWSFSDATFVAMFRTEKAFKYGDVFTTGVPIAADSAMNGFFVFAQSILDDDAASVQLERYKVRFSQFYPIYGDEVEVYQRIGLEAFWNHKDFDMYDIHRKPIRAQ